MAPETPHVTTKNHIPAFRFLDLPSEIRSHIYREYYGTSHITVAVNDTIAIDGNDLTDKVHNEHEHQSILTTTSPYTYTYTSCLPSLSLELTNHLIRHESIQIRTSSPSTLLIVDCTNHPSNSFISTSTSSFNNTSPIPIPIPFSNITTPRIHTYIPHHQFRATFACPLFDNDDMSLLLEPFEGLQDLSLEAFRVKLQLKLGPDQNEHDTNTDHFPQPSHNGPLSTSNSNKNLSTPQEASTYYTWRIHIRFRMELTDLLRDGGVVGRLRLNSLLELWFHIMVVRIQVASGVEMEAWEVPNQGKSDQSGIQTRPQRESWSMEVRVTGEDDEYDYDQLPESEQNHSGSGHLGRWWHQYLNGY